MNKILLALVATIASLSVAEQASAFYAAHLGRFCTRDPAGKMGVGRIGVAAMDGGWQTTDLVDRDQFDPYANYDDGLNLYQYVNSMPVDRYDATGLAMSGQYPRPRGIPCDGNSGKYRGGRKLPPCPKYKEECLGAGDWLDCMACCLSNQWNDYVRGGGTYYVARRKIKVESMSNVSTTYARKKEINSLSTKCANGLSKLTNTRIDRHTARVIGSRVVAVWAIAEGSYEWYRLGSCQSTCGSSVD